MTLILDLAGITDGDRARVGGKAAALAALDRAGHRVPRAFCLTTAAYERFVEDASLRPVIRQELGRKHFADMRWEEIWDVALRIRNRFERASVPDAIVDAIERRLAVDLADRPLAVRSSAPGEDDAETSFAGLHDSFVGVRGLRDTADAVREVWASLWTDRALLYRQELGIDPDTSAMAVLVQELVEGSCSGVAFGVHPAEPSWIAVEAVHGLNQGLVDGSIEPDRWAIDRVSGRVIEHTAPEVRRRLVLSGSRTVVEPLSPDLANALPLDPERLTAVVALTREVGELFGAPQDVEWTVVDDRVVALQSRPITTAAEDGEGQRAWYLSLTRSLDNLRRLRARVEEELLPAMDREADALAARRLDELDDAALAAELERRRAAHDRWVDVYWRDFIPLAHGIRLFGQFYNQVVRPEDPYAFMNLLAATPMISVKRNRALAELAARVRGDAELRTRLETGVPVPPAFEEEVATFERTFAGAVYADRTCFGDRDRLVRLVLAMAEAPPVDDVGSRTDRARLTREFLHVVDEERRPLAEELLALGRASYRLRDDDNIHLARLEALALAAVDEGLRRLHARDGGDAGGVDPDAVARALRHPNEAAEPRPAARRGAAEPGFAARPRQLVGQPAGPGVATGPARLVDGVDDLFAFRPGDVLVCDAIDPNMTFVVPLAAAVVERRGGMLIHGAIIAREYGLPCVTGVPQATSSLRTGDTLTVDGYLGIVTVTRTAGSTT